jgi:hypothetical protein
MLSRRQFLAASPAGAALVQAAAAQTGLSIRHVDIVHHTHTDVGYTALPAVVRDLQKRYLDVAIDACHADAGFRWTVESLLGLDDWWRASSPARRLQLTAVVQAGHIDVMGLPFNQTPFLSARQWRQMMSWIPDTLWRSMNIRAAMQNDVNGFPRAGAMALLDHGIHHFLMGLNPDSGGPPFRRPSAFWWKLPDSRRLFVWLGEHYGSVMAYLKAAREGDRMLTDEPSVRAAHADFVKRLEAIQAEGYAHQRLILTFTNPLAYDNGGPVPSLAPFIAAWNRLQLAPSLRLATATQAVLDMEHAIAGQIPEMQGEWTDWWANGDASAPREVAASRRAKRSLAAAEAPVFGTMPLQAQPTVVGILKDLCLFDEHTWGASSSVSAPYSLPTLGQFVEKSDLAYKPMGMSEALLWRRLHAKIAPLPDGLYVVNAAPAEVSDWATVGASALPAQSQSLVDVESGQRVELRREGGGFRFWLDKLPANSVRAWRAENSAAAAPASDEKPELKLDPLGWPLSAAWRGMQRPLFDGAMGDFLSVGVVPPADRTTIARLHANPDAEKREAIRRVSLRETAANYGAASVQLTPHTLVYQQEIRHDRLAQATRRLELWRREPRARLTVRFDRLSSLPPEVFFLACALPEASPMPVFASGGVPFTPYRDQLPGSCRDYFAIDGWAHYATNEGHWLWVTRDAPLVSVGSPHVVELHQKEPAATHRILAMVFDNSWHTNFVADSHGTMEFQFDLVWRGSMANPADLAQALVAEPLVLWNPAIHEPPAIVNHLYRP